VPAAASDALCLRTWDWSETSQTAVLLTRDHGLLRVLAKGSKRPKSVFSGGLEPLTVAAAAYHLKPTTELALLTRWDLIEIFPAFRAALPAHYAGLYLADLLAHALAPLDPHPRLFDAALAALRQLAPGREPAGPLLLAQWALLCESGFRPVLDAHAGTGAPLEAAPAYAFDPEQGGLIGPADAAPPPPPPPPRPGAPGAVDWRLRHATVELLRALPEDASALPPGTPPEAAARAARFLAAYWRHILGSPVPSLAWVFPDLVPETAPAQPAHPAPARARH
jgi:DNA repair protein RecO (recombination protein O)